jgi:hypothetical protein
MARADIRELYRELPNSQFAFLSRGEHDLDDIYRSVQLRFRPLCDDAYLCATNCASGHNQPEWKHTVRKSLQAQKSSAGPVSKDDRRGYWLFS